MSTASPGRWHDETEKLRTLLRGCGLEEATKWGKPCFMHDGRNVAIIQGFKGHCALMFFKGALLRDAAGLLRRQGANSQAARRLEFTGVEQIDAAVVRAYVEEAIAVEAAGLVVPMPAKDELDLPEELARMMDEVPGLGAAFRALTPGRRRSYVLHVAGAK